MTKTEAKKEYNRIVDRLDELGFDLGGYQYRVKSQVGPPEPMFLIGRQFELLRIILPKQNNKPLDK
jgi:hypothetical protein